MLMKTVTLSAPFDGQQIRLEDDYPLLKNARLLVTVLPASAESEDDFRQNSYRFAVESLARVYGENEPDYPDSCLKERNPLYDGR